MSCISGFSSSACYRLERPGRGSATAMHLKLQRLGVKVMMWWINGGKEFWNQADFCCWNQLLNEKTLVKVNDQKHTEAQHKYCISPKNVLQQHWLISVKQLVCGVFWDESHDIDVEETPEKKRTACLVHSKSQNEPCSILWDQHSLPA